MRIAAAVAVALALSAPAAAVTRPPQAGVVIPGRSLGGLELGTTRAGVERIWGRAYGACKDCRHETRYYNYFAFQSKGVGVEFRAGKVAAIFTLNRPDGWHTNRGLELGDPESRVTSLYGALVRRQCGGYSVLVLPGDRASTSFYVLDDRLWAFGLSRPGLPLCRT